MCVCSSMEPLEEPVTEPMAASIDRLISIKLLIIVKMIHCGETKPAKSKPAHQICTLGSPYSLKPSYCTYIPQVIVPADSLCKVPKPEREFTNCKLVINYK